MVLLHNSWFERLDSTKNWHYYYFYLVVMGLILGWQITKNNTIIVYPARPCIGDPKGRGGGRAFKEIAKNSKQSQAEATISVL